MNKSAVIIEDHLELAEVYKLTLNMLGYETELFTDGREALNRLMGPPPDLVILDMNLPSVSGHYIYKQIRGETDWDSVKIIVSTANSIVAEALQDGATLNDRILLKPVSPSQLKGVIEDTETE